MNKYYTTVNQNEIKFYKFNTFEYYCNCFLKKKKKTKSKLINSSHSDKAAFYFDQNSKLDALLDKYFARMNIPPDFSIKFPSYNKIHEETEKYIQQNEKLLKNTSKEVIYCIKKILRIKEKVDYFNTHFFSNSINIIVFIRSQINQFFESKPNIVINPHLIYSNMEQKNSDLKDSSKIESDDKYNYNYKDANFDVECSVEDIENYFENEFQNSALIKKAPSKIMKLCKYIQRHLGSRFQQIPIEDISQTIQAMSCIYNPDLLYIIPNIVDDFISSYVQDETPSDFEELKRIAVQIMAGNFYNTLHNNGPMHTITIAPTKEPTSPTSNNDNNNNSLNDKDEKNINDEENLLENSSSVESLNSYSGDDQKGNQTEGKSDREKKVEDDEIKKAKASKRYLIEQNFNKISFGPLRKLILKYCKLFKIKYYQPMDNASKAKGKKDKNYFAPAATNERMVLRCSFVRLLCNVLYTSFPGFLFEPVNPSFFSSCEIVRKATPKEMEINPKIICDYMMNTSFALLVESDDLYSNNSEDNSSDKMLFSTSKRKRSQTFSTKGDKGMKSLLKTENELKKASNLINETQFLTNPIDIINNIFCALNNINEFFQKCSIVKKYGSLNWKDTIGDNNEKEIIMQMNQNFLAFDDIFPLFCMVISYAAPSNAVAVNDFLKRTEDLKLGSQFEFAKLLFTSAVEYIINDVLNDLKKAENK